MIRIVLFVLLLAGFPSHVWAKLQLGLVEIAHLISDSEVISSRYLAFLDTLPETNKVFVPASRASKEFEKGYFQCLFPASERVVSKKHNIVASDPIFVAEAFVFSRFKDIDNSQLAKRRIAINRGFGFGGIRDQIDATFVELNNDSQTAMFLEKGRVDAIIAYLPDMKAAYQHLSKPLPHFKTTQPVYRDTEQIVCHKSAMTKAFLESVNNKIRQSDFMVAAKYK